MQSKVLLAIPAVIMLVLVIVLATRKKCEECKECKACQECKTCPTCPECEECPPLPASYPVLDSLLYNTTIPLNTGSRSLGVVTGGQTCSLPTASNPSVSTSINAGTYGQIRQNTDNSTKSQYPYIFRTYPSDAIARTLDGANYGILSTRLNPTLCNFIKDKVIVSNPLECATNTNCPSTKPTCKLDGNDITNNVCV